MTALAPEENLLVSGIKLSFLAKLVLSTHSLSQK